MKLSIITVNLNNRDGLKKTIDSVISQTFKDFEWIVIDGGSTDGSRELIEEYSDHFAYWCSEPDNGIYNAMNKGVTHAHGEYCQFLNSGDWLVSNILNEVIKHLDGDIIYGNANYWNHGNFIETTQYPSIMTIRFLYYSFLCHQSTFFKLSLFEFNHYNEDLKIVSDWEYYVHMMFDNKIFKYLPITVCNFEGNGISSLNSALVDKERKIVIAKYYPTTYKEDFRIVSRAESHLANIQLEEFNVLCERNKFFAKIITAVVLIMKKWGI